MIKEIIRLVRPVPEVKIDIGHSRNKKDLFINTNKEGMHCVKQAIRIANRCKLFDRLGLSKNEIEGYLAVVYLGIKLSERHLGRMQELKEQVELSRPFSERRLRDSQARVDGALQGLDDLNKSVGLVAENLNIAPERRDIVKKTIDMLVDQSRSSVNLKSVPSVIIKPEKSTLDTCRQQCRPLFSGV